MNTRKLPDYKTREHLTGILLSVTEPKFALNSVLDEDQFFSVDLKQMYVGQKLKRWASYPTHGPR
jgi:hypothetical protein